ncbi:hypothetical protein [Streptomyces noursei]|uniref:hypothetical protein n=1 Tax=Streptomyces noursei TaxID=1971 RepID=UPI0016724A96|nr:hypothetical protein [Streptomyces noursei]MCZ1019837.1 hypothetical protein [Streptomyces noursei]GGX36319.1 hypothetical protein GCM10010341_67230 [Streptomyces noursei]
MNDSARSTDRTTGPTPGSLPAGEQSTLTPSTSIKLALTTIAHLADELCEHLADNQWRAAARIRELAETTLPIAGER